MAGAAVELSPKTASKIGITGVGAEDLGVAELSTEIGHLFKLGHSLCALDKPTWASISTSEHGSSEQRELVEEAGSLVMGSLGQAVEARVTSVLNGWFDESDETYKEYLQWGRESCWEFPVVFGKEHVPTYAGLRIADEYGLRVLSCPVAEMPGPGGDALCAFVEWVTEECLKRTCRDLLEERLMMNGLFVEGVSQDALNALQGLCGDERIEWFKTHASEALYELSGYSDDPDDLNELVSNTQTMLVALHSLDVRISRVKCDLDHEASLPAIKDAAERIEDVTVREFVQAACDAFAGESTRKRIERLPLAEFERHPGEFCVVEMGLDLKGDEHQIYHDLNEYANGSDDFGWVPLDGDLNGILDVLERITVAERVLVRLSAML